MWKENFYMRKKQHHVEDFLFKTSGMIRNEKELGSLAYEKYPKNNVVLDEWIRGRDSPELSFEGRLVLCS